MFYVLVSAQKILHWFSFKLSVAGCGWRWRHHPSSYHCISFGYTWLLHKITVHQYRIIITLYYVKNILPITPLSLYALASIVYKQIRILYSAPHLMQSHKVLVEDDVYQGIFPLKCISYHANSMFYNSSFRNNHSRQITSLDGGNVRYLWDNLSRHNFKVVAYWSLYMFHGDYWWAVGIQHIWLLCITEHWQQ